MLICSLIIVILLSYFAFTFAGRVTNRFYAENYHNKMLIIYEYTRRVISDVYVAVTNNIYYIEHNLDKPDSHKEVMERIVKSGTRVRSCGVSFIENFYPDRGRRFCPYAWRNLATPDIVWSENMSDAAFDYLTSNWFHKIIEKDTAEWSDPFFDGFDQKIPLAAYNAPIHDETGRTVAALGADISLDWFTSKLNEMDSTVNAKSSFFSNAIRPKSLHFIINHDGLFITHPESGHIMQESFFSHLKDDEADIERLRAKMFSGITSEDESDQKYIYDGQESLVFYTPVKYTQWVIVTVVPWKSIEYLGYLYGGALLALIAIVMLIIVFAARFSLKNEAKRLAMCVRAADKIAEGDYNASLPEDAKSAEISALRDALANLQISLSIHSHGSN